MQLCSDKAFLATRTQYWDIDDKRNSSRKAFRNAFRNAFWLWVLKLVSKEENTAKVRSDTRLSQKHVSVVMINAKLFWNAFTMCPQKKKQNPETMENSCGVCDYYHIYFMKHAWLTCFRIIHNWNSSNHASLISTALKIECQKPLCHFQVHIGRGIVIIAVQCGLA